MVYLEGVHDIPPRRRDRRGKKLDDSEEDLTGSTSTTGTSHTRSQQRSMMNDDILKQPLHEIDEEVGTYSGQDSYSYERSNHNNNEYENESMGRSLKGENTAKSYSNGIKSRSRLRSSGMSIQSNSTQNSNISHSSRRSQLMRRRKLLNSRINQTSSTSLSLFEGNNNSIRSIDPNEEEKVEPKESTFYGWGDDFSDSCYTESELGGISQEEDNVELYVAFPESEEREASISTSSVVSRNEISTNTFEDVTMDDEYDSRRPWRKAPPPPTSRALRKTSMNLSEASTNITTIDENRPTRYVEERDKQTMVSSISSETRMKLVKANLHEFNNPTKIGTLITTEEGKLSDLRSASDVSELVEATNALRRNHDALIGVIRRNDSFSNSTVNTKSSQRSFRTLDTNFTTSTPIYRKPEPFLPGPAFEKKYRVQRKTSLGAASLGSFAFEGQQHHSSSTTLNHNSAKLPRRDSLMTNSIAEGDETIRDEDVGEIKQNDLSSRKSSQNEEEASIGLPSVKSQLFSPLNESLHRARRSSSSQLSSVSSQNNEQSEAFPSRRTSQVSKISSSQLTNSSIHDEDESSSQIMESSKHGYDEHSSSRRPSQLKRTLSQSSKQGSKHGYDEHSSSRRPSQLSRTPSQLSKQGSSKGLQSSKPSSNSLNSDAGKDSLSRGLTASHSLLRLIQSSSVRTMKKSNRLMQDIENDDLSSQGGNTQKIDVEENPTDRSPNPQKVDETDAEEKQDEKSNASDDDSDDKSREGELNLRRSEERNKFMEMAHLFDSDSDSESREERSDEPDPNASMRRRSGLSRRFSTGSVTSLNDTAKRCAAALKRLFIRHKIACSLGGLVIVIIFLAMMLGVSIFTRTDSSDSSTSNDGVAKVPSPTKSPISDEAAIIFYPTDSKPTALPDSLTSPSLQPSQRLSPTSVPTSLSNITNVSNASFPIEQGNETNDSISDTTTYNETLTHINDTLGSENEMVNSEDKLENIENTEPNYLNAATSPSGMAVETGRKINNPKQSQVYLRSPSPTVFTMWPTPVDTYTLKFPPPHEEYPQKKTLPDSII